MSLESTRGRVSRACTTLRKALIKVEPIKNENMKKHLLLAGLAAFSMASARAELITDYSQIKIDFIFKWGASYGPSVASMTLKLNDDGTVNAHLDAPDSLGWSVIELDSSPSSVNYFTNLSYFSGTVNGTLSPHGMNTPMGMMYTGLLCSRYCIGSADWKFGNVGQFSSLGSLLSGGHTWWNNIGPTPAYIRTTTPQFEYAQYFGGWNYVQVEKPDAPPPSNVPEPASMSLAGAGLMAIAVLRRRSRRRA